MVSEVSANDQLFPMRWGLCQSRASPCIDGGGHSKGKLLAICIFTPNYFLHHASNYLIEIQLY